MSGERMKSLDNQYEVLVHDFGEIGMGSPLFGRIEIRGAAFDTSGREFGEPMTFSSDSRFLDVEELMAGSPRPQTQVVVFDFKGKRQVIVRYPNPAWVKRLDWSSAGLLSITTWSPKMGEREHQWQAPAGG